MSSRARVYVARKECGCIVAAFPINMDKAIKGELLKQFSKAGYDLEQASEYDVLRDFHLTCDHNKPPLLAYMDERTAEGRVAVAAGEGVVPGEDAATSDGVVSPDASFLKGEEVVGEVEAGSAFELPFDRGDGQPLEEEHSFDEEPADNVSGVDDNDLATDDDGADQADVDALAGDISPEAEEADELLSDDAF